MTEHLGWGKNGPISPLYGRWQVLECSSRSDDRYRVWANFRFWPVAVFRAIAKKQTLGTLLGRNGRFGVQPFVLFRQLMVCSVHGYVLARRPA